MYLLLDAESAIDDLLIAPLAFGIAAFGIACLTVAVAVGLAVALIAVVDLRWRLSAARKLFIPLGSGLIPSQKLGQTFLL